MWHFTPERDGSKKPAKMAANYIVNCLREKNIDQTLKAIGGDSTSTNTGWQGGCRAVNRVEDWEDAGLDCL